MKLPEVFKKADPIYGIPVIGYVYRQNLEVAIELTKPYNKKVLDVGFGLGVLFPYITKYTDECYGLEINKTWIERTKKTLDDLNIKANLVRGDIRNAPFKDAQFDNIYMLNALEHVREIDIAISEIRRILKQKGLFVVAVPTENRIYEISRKFVGFKKPTDYYHTSQEIEVKLSQHFEIIKKKEIYSILPLFTVYLCRRD
jgi:ubiquinone/menaquinone biosynthesis C-methylase UbiE